MGYAHYLYHPLGLNTNFAGRMPAIAEDARAILEHCLEIVAGPDRIPETPPIVTESLIHFNGVAQDGHEPFLYPPEPGSLEFHFCKTERGRYDAVVVAVLMAVKHHMKDEVILTTDANPRDSQFSVPFMTAAEALYHSVFPDRSHESWLTSFNVRHSPET